MAIAVERQLARGDGVSFPAINRVVNAARIDILDDEGFRIGYVQQLQETLQRPVTRIRHLNSLDAGRTIEQAPGVEEASITLSGYSLYDKSLTDRGSLIHRLGGAMATAKSLLGQGTSFNLVMLETHPATGEQVKTRFLNCWITQYSRTRTINQVVQVDTCSIQVGIRA